MNDQRTVQGLSKTDVRYWRTRLFKRRVRPRLLAMAREHGHERTRQRPILESQVEKRRAKIRFKQRLNPSEVDSATQYTNY